MIKMTNKNSVKIRFVTAILSVLMFLTPAVICMNSISASAISGKQFSSKFSSREEMRAEFLNVNEQILLEGATLIKNEGSLPLKKDAKVTILGKNSVNLVYQGSGSSGNAGSSTKTIYDAFENSDFTYNPYAKTFYTSNSLSGLGRPGLPSFGCIPSGMPIGETRASGDLKYSGTSYLNQEADSENKNYSPTASQSNYNVKIPASTANNHGEVSGLRSTFSSYNDAAIVVISRIGGEGYDLPRRMRMTANAPTSSQYPASTGNGKYANTPEALALDTALMIPGARSRDSHYMQLDLNEINLLKEAANNFNNIIVVLNSASPIELDFLDAQSNDPIFGDISSKIKACLWIATPGENGIMALPKLLNGTVNPSGSLVDTYYRNFMNDFTLLNFGNNNIQNGNMYSSSKGGTNRYFVDYQEDIYMGYRYYETKYKEIYDVTEGDAITKEAAAEAWYNQAVCAPFGKGLSYTSFAKTVKEWSVDDVAKSNNRDITLTGKSNIKVEVEVKNTGALKGKKAVQIYVQTPYKNGGIEKAAKVFVGYEKTKELAPNAKQSVTVEIPAYLLASWDGTDANANGFKGYEIESGEYKLFVANDAHDSSIAIPFNITQTIMIDKDPCTDAKIKEIYPEMTAYMNTTYKNEGANKVTAGSARLSRANNFANSNTLTVGSSRRETTAEHIGEMGNGWAYSGKVTTDTYWETKGERSVSTYFDNALPYIFGSIENAQKVSDNYGAYTLSHPVIATEYSKTKIKFADMYGVDYNDPKWNEFMSELTWSEMAQLIGGNAPNRFSSQYIDGIGKPFALHLDGPVGWSTRTNQGEQATVKNAINGKTTQKYIFEETEKNAPIALASTCLVSASMDKDFQKLVGNFLGEDALWGYTHIDGTPVSAGYAPGVNTHRTPFSGRNFEYFSEDGNLSGLTAAQVIVGQQEKGVFAFIKHFFLNDQETNRDSNSLATFCTEQASREIYARAFELGIRAAVANNPKLIGVMSAFNRVGYNYAGNSYQSLQMLLRDEWGFTGDVITDWTGNSGAGGYMQTESLVLARNSKQLGTGIPHVESAWIHDEKWGDMYRWSVMLAAKDILFTDVNSNAIVTATMVRTVPINLSGETFNITGSKSGELVSLADKKLKVGAYFNYDLKTDAPPTHKPYVLYGERNKVKLSYSVAPWNTLPDGVSLSTDGKLTGTPKKSSSATTYQLLVNATGMANGKKYTYNTGIQNVVLKVNAQGVNDNDYDQMGKFKLDGAYLGEAKLRTEFKVSIPAAIGGKSGYTVRYYFDSSMPLPRGLTMGFDGVISGRPNTEEGPVYFRIHALKFDDAKGKLVEEVDAVFSILIRGEEATGRPLNTPTKGANGNWFFNNIDTGLKINGVSISHGIDGNDGDNGSAGEDGVNGDKGDKGDTGDKGDKGADGAKGEDSKNGGCGSVAANSGIAGSLAVVLAGIFLVLCVGIRRKKQDS